MRIKRTQNFRGTHILCLGWCTSAPWSVANATFAVSAPNRALPGSQFKEGTTANLKAFFFHFWYDIFPLSLCC